MKKIGIGIVAALFVAVGALALEVNAAPNMHRIDVEAYQKLNARCFVYEQFSQARKGRLQAYKNRLKLSGAIAIDLVYQMGYAEGVVNNAAMYNLKYYGGDFNLSKRSAAAHYLKAEGCDKIQDT